MIRNLEKKEDPTRVAEMIYDSDHLFCSVFGDREESISAVSKLMLMEGNGFSYRNIYVFDDGEVSGMLIGIPPGWKESMADDIKSILPLGRRIQAVIRMMMQERLYIHESDGAYIPNICVAEGKRGLGIGTELLSAYCKMAKDSGYSKVYLEVSFDNPRAKDLYEREGFECFASKRQVFGKHGMYHMRKIL